MEKNDTGYGLNSAEDVIQAADAITNTADMALKWVINHFETRQIDQAEAQQLFASINQVRHMANTLYATAGNLVVKDLGETQQNVLDIINSAKDTIATIQKAKLIIDIIADMVALAATINAGKPGPILASLVEVKKSREEPGKVVATGNNNI